MDRAEVVVVLYRRGLVEEAWQLFLTGPEAADYDMPLVEFCRRMNDGLELLG